MEHARQASLPHMLGFALALGSCLLLGGCQGGSSASSSSPSASAVASVSQTVSAVSVSATVPIISQAFQNPESVSPIDNLEDYIVDFPYDTVEASNSSSAWAELVRMASVSQYPEDLLEYTEYSLYQSYQDMAELYGKNLDTMLGETMGITHDEMVTEIKREAKAHVDAELVARYIVEKESLITTESLVELGVYKTPDDGFESGAEGNPADSISQANLNRQQVMKLADVWVTKHLVQGKA